MINCKLFRAARMASLGPLRYLLGPYLAATKTEMHAHIGGCIPDNVIA